MHNFAQDIPLDLAVRAHSGTSYVPEKRGEQMIHEYVDTLAADFASLSEYADTDEKRATLTDEFERYRVGYRDRYTKWLATSGRVVSVAIAGGSNFPVRRQQKIQGVEAKRRNEVIEFRDRALNAIKKTLCPELRPIMAGDADAVERLRSKITEAERDHENMKVVNAAHKAFLKDPANLDTTPINETIKEKIRTYRPQYTWEPHPIAPWQLTNNSANIRRLKQRLTALERTKALPNVVIAPASTNGIRLEDSPADNRVRLFFPGKPDEMVRSALKSKGFRWTPSLGCWQAYRNHNAITHAQSVTGAPPP